MKKIVKSIGFLTSLLGVAVLLYACGRSLEESEVDEDQVNPTEEVYMTTEETVYPEGTTEIAVTIVNQSNEQVDYGMPFSIEQSIEGQWYVIPFEDDAAFIMIAILLGPGDENTESIDLTLLGDNLEPGEYRVLKEVSGQTLSAEFRIE